MKHVAPSHARITISHVRRRRGPQVEQLGIGFEGIEVVERPAPEASPDTMRQIVSLRMPDALLARVEEAAQARGVSPSSLMRAFIAAGLDRSYAAVTEPSDLAAEVAELRRSVERIAEQLGQREADADVVPTSEGAP